jgi:hypothetical protein
MPLRGERRTVVLRHIVLLRWRPEIGADDRRATIDDLRELMATMPGAVAVVAAANLELAPGTFDAALVADFTDESAWRTYQQDPRHQDFVAQRLGPKLAERAAIQVPLGTSAGPAE